MNSKKFDAFIILTDKKSMYYVYTKVLVVNSHKNITIDFITMKFRHKIASLE